MVDSIWPGEQLAIRIWESVCAGIAGIASPYQIRREGKARLEVRRQEAELDAELAARLAKAKAGDIIAGRELLSSRSGPIAQISGETSPGRIEPRLLEPSVTYTQSPAGLTELASIRLVARETDRLLNLRAVYRVAEEIATELENATPASELPSDDWIRVWTDSVERVFDETVRNLWARILVGEVRTTGSYSIRTLNALSGITRKDAERFQNLSEYITHESIMPYPQESFKSKISIIDILELEAIGLLSGGGGTIGLNPSWEVRDKNFRITLFLRQDMLLEMVSSKNFRVSRIVSYPLTQVGKELASLCQFDFSYNLAQAIVDSVFSGKESDFTYSHLFRIGNKNPDHTWPILETCLITLSETGNNPAKSGRKATEA